MWITSIIVFAIAMALTDGSDPNTSQYNAVQYNTAFSHDPNITHIIER